MRSLILLLALVSVKAESSKKIEKRGILSSYGANSGLTLGISAVNNPLTSGLTSYGAFQAPIQAGAFYSLGGLNFPGSFQGGLSQNGFALPTNQGFGGLTSAFSAPASLGSILGASQFSGQAFDPLGQLGVTNTFSQSNQVVGVPSPIAVPVSVTRQIPLPVPQAVPVVVQRPYNVPVPQPVPIFVPRPYSVKVPRPVSVPVPQKVPVPVTKTIPVSVPQPYPVSIPQAVPVPVGQSIPFSNSGFGQGSSLLW